MSTFKIDYEQIDVETIMAQIRQRVKEKKGVVYSEEDVEALEKLELGSPSHPERQQYKGSFEKLDNVEKRDLSRLGYDEPEESHRERLTEEAHNHLVSPMLSYTHQHEVQNVPWNIDIHPDDLIRSHPGPKGKVVETIRKVNRKLFKLTMNMDVILFQFHRQAELNSRFRDEWARQGAANQFFLDKISDLFDTYVSKDSYAKTVGHIKELMSSFTDLQNDLINLQNDFIKSRNEMQHTIHEQNEDIKQLRFAVDNLRGLVEGQRQQIDFMLLRQRTLEKLALLKEDEEEEVKKISDLEKGRYQPEDDTEDSE